MKASSLLLLLALATVPCTLPAQTYILGDRLHSGYWTKDKSPYIVKEYVTIDSALIIEPGVEVIFESLRDGHTAGLRIDTNAYVVAIGTEDDSIIFKSAYDDYGWADVGAYLSTSTNVSLYKYCVFEDGGVHASCMDERKPDTVMHCSFRGKATGITAKDRGIYISHCAFTDSSLVAIRIDAMNAPAEVFVSHSEFLGITTGLLLNGMVTATVRNCVIANCYEAIALVGGSKLILGDAPEYCNKIYGTETYNLQKSWSVKPVQARYNYWGSTDSAVIAAQIAEAVPGGVSFIPYSDENCEAFPLSVESPTPASFSLSPAYPNPVSAGVAAQVQYSLPTAGNITLLLHDALGRELRRISKRVEPGTHAESIPTAGLTPGVYYYSVLANGQKKTEMLIVR